MPTKVTRSAKAAPRKGPVFPIRKPKLVTAAQAEAVQPINAGKVRAHYLGKFGFHAVVWGQYIAFSALLLTALYGGFLIHRTLTLAEVGELTCSAENSMMWLEEDPGSKVPRLNDAVMSRCAKAYNPLG